MSDLRVGGNVVLRVTIQDIDESEVDPSTLQVVVTQPDGTDLDALTLAGGGITKISTGIYKATFAPTQSGEHTATFTSTAPKGIGKEDFWIWA